MSRALVRDAPQMHVCRRPRAIFCLVTAGQHSLCSNSVHRSSLPRTVFVKFLALEGIRWIAAVHIYIFHLNQTLTVGCADCVYECRVCKYGKYEVLLFFIVSGFISSVVTFARAGTSALPQKSSGPTFVEIRTFWLNRVLPLMPLYLVSIALALFGAYYNRPSGSHLAAGYSDAEVILRTLTMTTTWFAPFHFDLNGPAWFLENLVIFWILTPHWMHAVSLLGLRGQWFVLALCWAVMWGPHIAMYVLSSPF
jgi:peptidoglycan/LPS O-acetylase OafA/YrhL